MPDPARAGPAPLRPPDLDRPLTYRGLHDRAPVGRCRARVWRSARPVVLLTEVEDNPGPSVTNAAEAACSAVELMLGLQHEEFDLVEHYEPNLFRPAALAVVTFAGRDSFSRPWEPSWSPIPARLDWLEAAALIG